MLIFYDIDNYWALKSINYIWVFLYAFLINGFESHAQAFATEKSQWILDLSREVSWSRKNLGDTFHIQVYGDAQDLYNMLSSIAPSTKIFRKPISVEKISSVDAISKPNVLIVAPNKNDQLIRITQKIGTDQVLVITDNYVDDKFIMINFVGKDKASLSYRVNRISFLRKKMKYTPKLLALGGSEIDLVKLYSRLENEIFKQEQLLASNRVELTNYKSEIKDSKSEIKVLIAEIEQLKRQIAEHKVVIRDQDNTIIENNSKLNSLTAALHDKESELVEQLNKLEVNEEKAAEVQDKIEASQIVLNKQEKLIDEKSDEIRKQQTIISSKEDIINYQRNILYLTTAIIFLIGLLILIILRGRRIAKRATEFLSAKNKELEFAKSQLSRSLDKEKKLNQIKSQFVSTASHQFRTPMAIIQSNIGILDMQKEHMNPETRSRFDVVNARIKQQINQMTSLMDEILILGKIDSGSIKPNFELTDLEKLCREIIESYNAIQKDNRTIQLQVTGVPRSIMIDKKFIDNALSNLVSNAFKFSMGKQNPEMHLVFDDKRIKITVIDYGVGIPPEDLEHIFNPFFRAENVREIHGTGLGTTIAREYIEQNNGKLEYQSDPGVKTSAIVTFLPIEKNSAISANEEEKLSLLF